MKPLHLLLAFATLFAVALNAHAATPAEEVQASIAALRATLKEDQAGKLLLPFNDDARLGWNYLPGDRKGLPLKAMSVDQQKLALAVVQTGLSNSGFKKVELIRSMDQVLKDMNPADMSRDTKNYYLAIFGDPAKDSAWGFRWEGHHLSLNWTIVEGKIIASTPQFLGSNPADVKQGPLKGTRPLGLEEDMGRGLVKSLNNDQAAQAILGPIAPADILTKMTREAAIQEDKGIAFTALSPEQQGVLINLINEYANVQRPELAKERLDKLKSAGMDKVKFGWMGGLEKGQGHYYRIQGPTFLIEYDNTQNDANHIHTVWRDFNGDFGVDILKEHYKEHASPDHPGEHIH